ncbi:hypothetical protein [Candidatus Poriferisodalis sp.]|uniref:hypothetical protein n=1 Tax=Candidatus Poriferisodalis sp. TaxID=3101277 RepID=UPI003B01F848
MPAGLYHPFSGALYERQHEGEAGDVVVTDGELQGVFSSEGQWISGSLRECDPQMCNWIAGPQVANHRVSEAAESAQDR